MMTTEFGNLISNASTPRAKQGGCQRDFDLVSELKNRIYQEFE